jgi:low affinity Fe/Cu permease
MASMITRGLTRVGTLLAHPSAFLIVACYVAAWIVLSPNTLEWHSIATIATWLMTLFIQRAEHRDTQAIHAKLDELLRAEGKARSDLVHLDNEEPEVIQEHRDRERKTDG